MKTKKVPIDSDYLIDVLGRMCRIPSPSGFTDEIVHFTGEELERLGIPFELTRRGAIRADIEGKQKTPDRAVVAHLDTLGAMVRSLKSNGRMSITPIGTWSSRFAEGSRVTVFTDQGSHRGTVLPLKASGHTFNEEVDTQPVNWDQIEIRVDEHVRDQADLEKHGFNVGDFVAFDSNMEVTENGYINARHLDNKAGVASLLAAAKAIVSADDIEIPVDCHLLFTITEEIGSGASAVLHRDVAEMLTIDNATQAPGQSSSEHAVTIGMKDSVGPFDYHLTRKLLDLCRTHDLAHRRDVFRYYRCDSAAAIEAGNDIRTALACFAVDSSHGYERAHLDGLRELSALITLYCQSEPTFARDVEALTSLEGFPEYTQQPYEN